MGNDLAHTSRSGSDQSVGSAASPGPTSTPPESSQRPSASALRGLEFNEQEKLLEAQSDTASRIRAILRASNVEDSRFGRALHQIETIPPGQRAAFLRSMRDHDGDSIDDLLTNTPPSQRTAHARGWLSLLTVVGEVSSIVSTLYQGPSATGLDPAASKPELSAALAVIPSADLARFAGLEPGLWTKWTSALDDERWREIASSKEANAYAKPEANPGSDVGDPRAADDARLQDRNLAKKLTTIEDLMSYGAFDWAITDKEATRAFKLLQGLGDADAVGAVIRRLDARGPFVDRLLDNVPAEVRWNNKTAFLGIAAARDTSKLVRFVKDILAPGFLGGVDDEEARLVFNIVQRLPERDRERFRHLDDGRWWQKMCGELDIQDKGATDTNFYEDDAAMQKLLADLSANLETWPKARVDNAVGMLIAERKTDDVEKLLQDRGLDTKAEHDWLFDKYGLARAGGQRDPKVHGRFKAKSTGQKIAEAFGEVGAGASLVGQALSGDVESPTMNIDLEDAQTVMGGDLGGVELSKRGKGADDAQTNKLLVRGDRKEGRVDGEISRLGLARMALISGQNKLQSGPVTVDGVRFQVKFGSPEDTETWLRIQVAAIDATDLMRTTDRSMQRLGRAHMKDLAVAAESPKGFENSRLPFVALYANAFETVKGLLSDIPEQVAHLVATMDFTKPDPALVAAGLSQAFGGLSGASVRLGGLALEGLSLGTEGFVEGVSLEGLSLDLRSKQKGAIARQKIAALEEQERSPAQDQELASLRDELTHIVPLETRLAELEKKKKTAPLPMHEEALRKRIAAELTVTTTEISLDALRVQGVDMGTFTLKSGALTDLDASITGQTRSSAERASGERGPAAVGPGVAVRAAAGLELTGLNVPSKPDAAKPDAKPAAASKGQADSPAVKDAAPPRKGGEVDPATATAVDKGHTAQPAKTDKPALALGHGQIGRLEATLDEQGAASMRATDVSVKNLEGQTTSVVDGKEVRTPNKLREGGVEEVSARGQLDWVALAGRDERGEALDLGSALSGAQGEVKGAHFQNLERGTEGTAGYREAESGGFDRATIDHKSGEVERAGPDGTRTTRRESTTTVTGLEGFQAKEVTALGMSKKEALDAKQEELGTALARTTDPAQVAKIRRHLKTIAQELARFESAKLAVGRARNETQRTKAKTAFAQWNQQATTTIASIDADIQRLTFTSDDSGRIAASIEADRVAATGIVSGDNKVGALEVKKLNANMRAQDVKGETQLDGFDATLDSATVNDAKTRGAGAKKATATNAKLAMNNGATTAEARTVSASGAYAGGNSAGWIGATNAKATITERGVSGRAGSAAVRNARSKGKGHDASADTLDARGVDFAASGGQVSANAKKLKAEGAKAKLAGPVDAVTGQQDTTNIDAKRIEADNARFASKGEAMTASADRLGLTDGRYESTAHRDGHTTTSKMHAGEASIEGAALERRGDGTAVKAKRIEGRDIGADIAGKDQAVSGSVERVVVDDAKATLSSDGKVDASVGAAVVTNAKGSSTTTRDGQVSTTRGEVGEAAIRGGALGKSADGRVAVAAQEVAVVDAKASMSDPSMDASASLERAEVRGAQAEFAPDGRVDASAESARVDGVSARRYDHHTGTVDAVDSKVAEAKNLSARKDERGLTAEVGRLSADGKLVREAPTGRVEASGKLEVVDAGVELAKDGTLRAEFGEVRGDQIVFKDKANRVDVLLDFFKVGDRQGERSKVAATPDGILEGDKRTLISADIKTIEVGNGHAEVGDHHMEVDEVKARLVAKDFDSSDLSRAGSSLAIRDFQGKKFAWDQYNSVAFVDGVDLEHFKADSLWVRGLGENDRGDQRFAAGAQGLSIGEGRLDMDKANPSFRGYTVDEAGAVFKVGEKTDVVAAWAEGVNLAHTQVSAHLIDPVERQRRELATDNRAWLDEMAKLIAGDTTPPALRGDGFNPVQTNKNGERAWEKASKALTESTPGEYDHGDRGKHIATNVLDNVDGHVTVKVPPLFMKADAQVDVPVKNGKIKVTEIRARLGALPISMSDGDVTLLDMFDDGLAGVELIEGDFIPMSKFIDIMNATNGSKAGRRTRGPILDTDTGPTDFSKRIEVTAHVTNLKGTTTIGNTATGEATEVVMGGGSVSATGNMDELRLGAKDLEVDSMSNEASRLNVERAKVKELHVTAKDLGEPDKHISVVMKGAHIDKVTQGSSKLVDAGRSASKDERGERGAKKGFVKGGRRLNAPPTKDERTKGEPAPTM